MFFSMEDVNTVKMLKPNEQTLILHAVNAQNICTLVNYSELFFVVEGLLIPEADS